MKACFSLMTEGVAYTPPSILYVLPLKRTALFDTARLQYSAPSIHPLPRKLRTVHRSSPDQRWLALHSENQSTQIRTGLIRTEGKTPTPYYHRKWLNMRMVSGDVIPFYWSFMDHFNATHMWGASISVY